MDLIDKLKQIGERIIKLKNQVKTEEATKNAFIMPFIQSLGYDVFNPMEVVPEYTADVGTKRGEKVDYCLLKNGEACILIEAKHWNRKLDVNKSNQLHRYFHATNAKFAILTNGIIYQFFTDLDKENVMDPKPFMEISMLNLQEQRVNELKKFHKDQFDIDAIIGSASELKYSKEFKELIQSELNKPSDDFVKYLANKVYDGRLTSKVIDQLKPLVQKSIKTLLNEMINDKLQMAIEAEDEVEDNGIITTEEELQGYRIVQAILMEHLSEDRISYSDKKRYFNILLDKSSRKVICRLHFNSKQKYVGIFDEHKNEIKKPIDSVGDIFKHRMDILDTVSAYQNGAKQK